MTFNNRPFTGAREICSDNFIMYMRIIALQLIYNGVPVDINSFLMKWPSPQLSGINTMI